MFEPGDKIKLVSFDGVLTPPEDCDPMENYWLLIGESGVIAEPDAGYDRVLVKFDVSVKGKGLHCHNEIPNSLYILKTDLECY